MLGLLLIKKQYFGHFDKKKINGRFWTTFFRNYYMVFRAKMYWTFLPLIDETELHEEKIDRDYQNGKKGKPENNKSTG